MGSCLPLVLHILTGCCSGINGGLPSIVLTCASIEQMRQLVGKYGVGVTEQDLVSHAQYPAVFKVRRGERRHAFV